MGQVLRVAGERVERAEVDVQGNSKFTCGSPQLFVAAATRLLQTCDAVAPTAGGEMHFERELQVLWSRGIPERCLKQWWHNELDAMRAAADGRTWGLAPAEGKRSPRAVAGSLGREVQRPGRAAAIAECAVLDGGVG